MQLWTHWIKFGNAKLKAVNSILPTGAEEDVFIEKMQKEGNSFDWLYTLKVVAFLRKT